MDCETLIPFTFRTVRPAPKVATMFCKSTIDMLVPIINEALKPFDDARQALVRALINFSEENQVPA